MYLSTLLPIGSKVLLGFENKFCTERTTDEDLTSTLGWKPRLSFIVLQPCVLQSILLTRPSHPCPAALAFSSSPAICTKAQNGLFSHCPTKFQPLALIAKVSEVETQVTLETSQQGEKMDGENQDDIVVVRVCLVPAGLFACIVLNALCPACHSSRRVSHTHNCMPFRVQTPNM